MSARVLAVVRLIGQVLTDLRGPNSWQNTPAEDAFVLRFAGLDGDLAQIEMTAKAEMGLHAESVLRGGSIT